MLYNYTSDMTDESTPRHFSLSGISWLTIVFGLLAIITFFAVNDSGGRYVTQMMGLGGGMSYTSVEMAVPPTAVDMVARESGASSAPSPAMMDSKAYYPDRYPYYSPDVPVTDTREFLKVYYNAIMRTRDVQGLTRRVETTVRGYDGRIDQESSSPKYGSVSFVVPQSKYDAFRTELESLVGSRFLTLNISSQNLLPQKQNIEEQQKQADTSLAGYKTARQNIVSAHASTLKSLQSQIDAIASRLATLRAQTQTYDVQIQIQSLSNDLYSLNQQLANENTSYSAQLKNADANIKSAQDWQKAVQTQDQNLLDNVATVSGTVSIQWISLWETAQLYLPGYWIPAIFAFLTFLSYLYDRRRIAVV